jgi:nicotinamide mononucleotide transporter
MNVKVVLSYFSRMANLSNFSNRKELILEILAVTSNLLFTFLYLRGVKECFVFGLLGPMLLGILCFRRKLYAETFLQIIYVLSTIIGLINFSNSGFSAREFSGINHLILISSGVIIVFISGYFLKKNTDAQLPYIDSVTTVYGIIGTILMMFFIHENWLYFIFINAISIFMYFKRRMVLSSLMYLLYLVMSLDGYFYIGIFT